MVKKIATILSVILGLCVLVGYAYKHDTSLARASDVLKVREEIRLMNKRYADDKKTNRAQTVQQRLWTLDERYRQGSMPQSVAEEYRSLQVELQRLRMEGY